MTKNDVALISLFLIYLLMSCYIAYEAQFISAYLESRDVLQEEYEYPLSGVLFCCGLYLLVILNYIPLFLLKFSHNHPAISFILANIIPVFMLFYSFLGAMHASSFWGAFIFVMMITCLVHFCALPFLLKRYRNI